jgi:hypothetical protein
MTLVLEESDTRVLVPNDELNKATSYDAVGILGTTCPEQHSDIVFCSLFVKLQLSFAIDLLFEGRFARLHDQLRSCSCGE